MYSKEADQTRYFKATPSNSLDTFDIVHCDVCGPIEGMSKGEANDFVTFIDKTSRWISLTTSRINQKYFVAFTVFGRSRMTDWLYAQSNQF